MLALVRGVRNAIGCRSESWFANRWNFTALAALGCISVALTAHAVEGPEKTAAEAIDGFDRVTRLQKAAERVRQLEDESFRAASRGEIDVAGETMSEVCDLARSEFGAAHWLTRLEQSLAEAVRSLAELPPAKRQLFIEASKGQLVSNQLWEAGSRQRAVTRGRQEQEKHEQALGPNHVLSACALLRLAEREAQVGEFDRAKVHAETVVPVVKAAWGEKSPCYAHALYCLAIAESGLHERDVAEQHFLQAAELLEPIAHEGVDGYFMLLYAGSQLYLARLLNEQERYSEAEPFARRGCTIHGINWRSTYANYLEGQIDLARSLSGQGKDSEAELVFACLMKAVQPNPSPEGLARVLTPYAEHLRRMHHDQDAKRLEDRVRSLTAQSSDRQSKRDAVTEAAPAGP